jgi:lysophospholipase L1-like esterase
MLHRRPGTTIGWALLATVWLASVIRAADVHVAPAGNDAASGEASRPVATLRRALDRVRELRAADPNRATPLVVELAAGRHELADTLVLLPEDSGTERSPTIIRAAAGTRPVVSGGRVLSGWRESLVDGRPRWTVDLPDVKADGWRFSQLFVNDQRRFRPVLPTAGWHAVAAKIEPSSATAGKGHDRFAFTGDDLRSDWAGRGDVEVVAVHRWTMSRLPIGTIEPNAADPATRIVTFAGQTRAPVDWCSFPKGARFLVENAREALGSAGSWYLDRSAGTLTYCPQPGETPAATVVVAPRLDRLVEFRGDVAAGRHVSDVRFEGISFAHGNWNMPDRGQSFPQAEVNTGGTIAATAARRIGFTHCAVRHVGRYALEFGAGCQDCTVERCELVDLGGGGVLIGTAGGPKSWGATGAIAGPEGEVRGISVRDCTIAHGGRIHSAAVGVWIGHASECTVEHCHIHDLTYTGISVGWVWGYAESKSHHNRILHNHIHDIGHGVLSDMGAVYTLGVSPGTAVEGNLIHDITSHDYGGWGLYTDEGSTGIAMRRNLVYRTSSGGFHQHYGRDNLIEHNIFAAARDWQLQRSRVEEHTSFRFERNIIWWETDVPLVKGDWTKGLVTKANCYWHAGKPVTFPNGPAGQDLAARQAAGQDKGSIVADPRFKDPARGDFTIAADSPVHALGVIPFDSAAVGRRSPPTLAPSLPEVPTIWIRPVSKAPPDTAASAVAPPAVPAVEHRTRNGLPRFFAKAKAGGDVRVAYLGGSITAAPGWRVKSLAWLAQRFPQARFTEINAAIGGTGSDLGAFRVGQDVLAGRPDLVFIEFAVNDGSAPPEQIMATMEGIVRQIRRADAATDICFVYTLSEPVVPDLLAGRCQRSAAAMEAVADHYGIPSVHFGVEVAKRIAAGTLTFKGTKPEPFDPAAMPMLFSTDGVHPLVETGHVLYADVLARAFETFERLPGDTTPQPLPAPLRPDHWEAATLVPIASEMLKGDWRRVAAEDDPQARSFARRMPVLWKAEKPGASLVLRVTIPPAPGVKTRRVAVYDLLGPGAGMVQVRVDGGPPRKLARFDPYCTYWRLATLSLGDLAPGEHEVELTLLDEKPDKRAILFEKNRADFDQHPDKYAPHVWYASCLLTFAAEPPQ